MTYASKIRKIEREIASASNLEPQTDEAKHTVKEYINERNNELGKLRWRAQVESERNATQKQRRV